MKTKIRGNIYKTEIFKNHIKFDGQTSIELMLNFDYNDVLIENVDPFVLKVLGNKIQKFFKDNPDLLIPSE